MSKIAELYAKEVLNGSLGEDKIPAKLQKEALKVLSDLKKQESTGD